jgi:hypothetical protein
MFDIKLMKLSINIPDKWGDPLRRVAAAAGYKSVNEYLRSLIAEKINDTQYTPASWGGKRQVPQVEQDAHVEQVAQPDEPEEDTDTEELRYEDLD